MKDKFFNHQLLLSMAVNVRYLCLIPILLAANKAWGQGVDKRAVLEIQGSVNEISVSPTGAIWLGTAIGNVYHTDHIDSNWHEKRLLEKPDEYAILRSHFERVSFFNADTAILTGYFSTQPRGMNKNGYYRTTDGGKTWSLQDFGGDSWAYTAYVDAKGNAWLGGLHQEVYYSGDYAQSWRTMKIPLQSSDRIYGIFMRDAHYGIASSDENELMMTRDNWETAMHLPTPLDQKRYVPKGDEEYDSRIDHVVLWGDFLVVNQKGHVYYSATGAIDWKEFPVKVVDFALDEKTNHLWVVTDQREILSYSRPLELEPGYPPAGSVVTHHWPEPQLLPFLPEDMVVVNHSLYVLCDDHMVCRVEPRVRGHEGNVLTCTLPHTMDYQIPMPEIVRAGKGIVWGASERQIYIAEDSALEWHRIGSTAFYVGDLKVLDDSTVMLWDGRKHSYRYSLHDKTPQPYFIEHPLAGFLRHLSVCFPSVREGVGVIIPKIVRSGMCLMGILHFPVLNI